MKLKQVFIFSIFVFLSTTCVVGQGNKTYKSFSERTQEDRELLIRAKSIAKTDPTEAIRLLQKALEIAIPAKNYDVEGEALFVLGGIYLEALQYDIAIDYYNKSLSSFQKTSDEKEIYKLTKSLAQAEQADGRYQSSLRTYSTFLQLARKKGIVKDQLFAHQQRASIFLKLNETQLASDELDPIDSLNRLNLLDVKDQLNNSIVRGEVYEAQSLNEAAYEEYEKSESLSKSIDDNEGILKSNEKQRVLLDKQGKKKEAVEKGKENLKLLKEFKRFAVATDSLTELEEEESRLNMNIGKTYLELDSADKAIDYFKSSISSNREDLIERKTAFGYLSEAYLASNQGDSALIAYKTYVQLVDAIYKKREKQIEASLILNKELVQSMTRINSLEKDRELQEKTIALLKNQKLAEEQSNRQLKLVVFGLLLFLVLSVILIYFMNKSSKQKKITNQLLALKNLRTQMNPHFIFNALNWTD